MHKLCNVQPAFYQSTYLYEILRIDTIKTELKLMTKTVPRPKPLALKGSISEQKGLPMLPSIENQQVEG